MSDIEREKNISDYSTWAFKRIFKLYALDFCLFMQEKIVENNLKIIFIAMNFTNIFIHLILLILGRSSFSFYQTVKMQII